MQRNGRNKAIEGYMVGLIIHFCGVVTGFAFNHGATSLLKKEQVVTDCVLSMHSCGRNKYMEDS